MICKVFNLKILLFFLLISSILGCNSKRFYFPSRLKKIENLEVNNLITAKFKLRYLYSDDKKDIKVDSILIFKKNGVLSNGNKKIGNWDLKRNIYFDKMNLKCYISYLGKNGFTITSMYKTKKDSLIKTIIFKFFNTGIKFRKTEEDELDF